MCIVNYSKGVSLYQCRRVCGFGTKFPAVIICQTTKSLSLSIVDSIQDPQISIVECTTIRRMECYRSDWKSNSSVTHESLLSAKDVDSRAENGAGGALYPFLEPSTPPMIPTIAPTATTHMKTIRHLCLLMLSLCSCILSVFPSSAFNSSSTSW